MYDHGGGGGGDDDDDDDDDDVDDDDDDNGDDDLLTRVSAAPYVFAQLSCVFAQLSCVFAQLFFVFAHLLSCDAGMLPVVLQIKSSPAPRSAFGVSQPGLHGEARRGLKGAKGARRGPPREALAF